jgi:hypothetical protein
MRPVRVLVRNRNVLHAISNIVGATSNRTCRIFIEEKARISDNTGLAVSRKNPGLKPF